MSLFDLHRSSPWSGFSTSGKRRTDDVSDQRRQQWELVQAMIFFSTELIELQATTIQLTCSKKCSTENLEHVNTQRTDQLLSRNCRCRVMKRSFRNTKLTVAGKQLVGCLCVKFQAILTENIWPWKKQLHHANLFIYLLNVHVYV